MLTHPTHDRLVALGLTGMAKALEEQRKQTDIASHKIRRGEIDPSEFDRIAIVAREMETLPLYIDETGGLSVGGACSYSRS